MDKPLWEVYYDLYREFSEKGAELPETQALAQTLFELNRRNPGGDQGGVIRLFSLANRWERDGGRGTWSTVRDKLRDEWTDWSLGK